MMIDFKDKASGLFGAGISGLGGLGIDIPSWNDIPPPLNRILGALGTFIPWLLDSPSVPQPTWTLSFYDEVDKPYDERSALLMGMYDPINFTISHANMVPELQAMGIRPIVQGGSESARILSFTGHWDARNQDEDLTDLYNKVILKHFDAIDSITRSKPILYFSYREIHFTGLLQSVRMRRGPSWWGEGYPKWIEMDFSLKKFHADGTLPPPVHGQVDHSTFYHKMKGGETFEDLALRYYGNPDMGLFIRLANPEVFEEYAGLEIKVLPPDHSLLRRSISVRTLNEVFFDADGVAAMMTFAAANEEHGPSLDWHEQQLFGSSSLYSNFMFNGSFMEDPTFATEYMRLPGQYRPLSTRVWKNGQRWFHSTGSTNFTYKEAQAQRMLVMSAVIAAGDEWIVDYEDISGALTGMVVQQRTLLVSGTTNVVELYDSTPLGVGPDGVTIYPDLNYQRGTTQVWIGTAAGSYQDFKLVERNGTTGYTYTEVGSSRIQLGFTLGSGLIIVDYLPDGYDHDLVIHEIPTGLVNGSNTTYTTEFEFEAGSTQVYYKASGASQGGLRQLLGSESGQGTYYEDGSQTIEFNVAPVSGGKVIVTYRRKAE